MSCLVELHPSADLHRFSNRGKERDGLLLLTFQHGIPTWQRPTPCGAPHASCPIPGMVSAPRAPGRGLGQCSNWPSEAR